MTRRLSPGSQMCIRDRYDTEDRGALWLLHGGNSSRGCVKIATVKGPEAAVVNLADKLCATAEVLGYWKRSRVREKAMG